MLIIKKIEFKNQCFLRWFFFWNLHGNCSVIMIRVWFFPFLFFFSPLFREVCGGGYWSFTRGQNPKPNFWGILLACFSGKPKPMSKHDNLRPFYPETWRLWSIFFSQKNPLAPSQGPLVLVAKWSNFSTKKKKKREKNWS